MPSRRLARPIRRRALVLVGAVGMTAAALAGPAASADSGSSWSIADVGPFGGEPSMAVAPNGTLYDMTPSGGMRGYRSTDAGQTWTAMAKPDASSGDDCLATDQSGAVYACNLAGSVEQAPLQADVWKTTDGGQHWAQGGAVGGQQATCGTSCMPFGVDRDWLAASIPAGKTTDDATVVLMYHDFYGPSSIWVNISHDGGKTFGPTTNVIAPPAATPGAVSGSIEAEGYTFCSTVPAGVSIVPPGQPHAGRIIAGWIAADAPQDAAACNISQYETFHTLWVSYSDDGGSTWTPQLAYDAGVGHDASTPFVAYTTDVAGNPYFSFATNANANPATCFAESDAGTLQSDPTCEDDMYVVWSKDTGATWDGGGGTIPGSAAAAYRVNPASETGTHWFPAIAANQPGQVEVAYLRTPFIQPTGPTGKADPGACSGKQSPPDVGPCPWDLYTAQSSDLTQAPDKATWTITDATPTTPMHVGDICNLGIACVSTAGSSRSLLDFIQMSIDPTTGCGHVAYADDNVAKKLRAANQTAGCFDTLGADVPQAPATALLLPLGVGALAVTAWARRRRRVGASG